MGSCRDRKWVHLSFGYTWPGRGTKAHRPNMSPPDRNRNPEQKPTDLFPLRSPFVLTTLGHPSPHLFPLFHRNVPLGRIQHHTRQQCLPQCVIFSTTRHGSMPLSHTHRHNTIRQCFVSLYQPHLHVRWQRLPLSVMLNTIKNGSVCPSGSHST